MYAATKSTRELFAELVVRKVLQTTSFGEVTVKMSTAIIDIGKEVLNALMAECL